jgi:hypothetical protein
MINASLGTSLAAPRPFKINLLARPWRDACACLLRGQQQAWTGGASPIVATPRFGALRAAAVELAETLSRVAFEKLTMPATGTPTRHKMHDVRQLLNVNSSISTSFKDFGGELIERPPAVLYDSCC